MVLVPGLEADEEPTLVAEEAARAAQRMMEEAAPGRLVMEVRTLVQMVFGH